MPGRLGATMGIWPKSGMGSCARPNGHSKAGRIEPGPAGWPKLGRHHGQAEQRDGDGVRSLLGGRHYPEINFKILFDPSDYLAVSYLLLAVPSAA
eukprot:SAG31_NODE_1299_length_8918_cov_59.994671_7_plen_95_part_00